MISEIGESFIKVNSDEPDEVNGNRKVDKEICENEISFGGPTFFPPLYVQRYSFVRSVLEKNVVKSVVDFGSAECKIITLLKTVPSLQNIALVDKDGVLLNGNKWCTKPSLGDYLQRRTNPLTVQVFEGSATMLDERIVGYEAATMIELIEHLYDEELSEVTQCVFGCLEPRLVIVTTPNSDFNELFTNFHGKRHWDHKFEWSRQQFNTWCQAVCKKFDYDVEISGIGKGPPGTENLGFCSQAAIFTQNSWSSSVDPKGCLCYKLIQSTEFPFNRDNPSLEESLETEVAYCLHEISCHTNSDLDSPRTVYVPLTKLVDNRRINELCDMEKLREFVSSRYTLTNDKESVIYVVEEEEADSDAESDLDSDWVVENKSVDELNDQKRGTEVIQNEALWD